MSKLIVIGTSMSTVYKKLLKIWYIYTYVYIYICMYYHTQTCPPGHCHNSFMATDVLGHTHVRLHVVGIQAPS